MINCQCPQCSTKLSIPDQYAGTTGKCKHCGSVVVVPSYETTKACPKCGMLNQAVVDKCASCGSPFAEIMSESAALTSSNPMLSKNAPILQEEASLESAVIPSRNSIPPYPLRWFAFWIYFRLPLGAALLVGNTANIILPKFAALFPIFASLSFALFIAIIIVGLHSQKRWGWELNWVLIVVEWFVVPLNQPGDFAVRLILFLIWGTFWVLPNVRYFYRRRVLFEGETLIGPKVAGIGIIVLLILVVVSFGNTTPQKTAQVYVAPQSKLDKAVDEILPDLMNSPVFMNAIKGKSPAEGRAFGALMSSKGIKRLQYRDLVVWNEIRLKLSMTSSKLCAALWKGGDSSAEMQKAIETLSDDDIKRWMEMSKRAILLEIENAPYRKATDEDAALLFQVVGSGLSEKDRSRFLTSASKGVNLPDDEACWVMLTIETQLTRSTIDTTTRERILRVLAGDGS